MQASGEALCGRREIGREQVVSPGDVGGAGGSEEACAVCDARELVPSHGDREEDAE